MTEEERIGDKEERRWAFLKIRDGLETNTYSMDEPFLDYLAKEFLKDYPGDKEHYENAFNAWLENLDIGDLLEYGNSALSERDNHELMSKLTVKKPVSGVSFSPDYCRCGHVKWILSGTTWICPQRTKWNFWFHDKPIQRVYLPKR